MYTQSTRVGGVWYRFPSLLWLIGGSQRVGRSKPINECEPSASGGWERRSAFRSGP